MSGYLYPYTPYPTAGNLQTSGQAFLGGFSTGQEIEGRAQEMDARNQLQKLRQAQEERERQTFPLRIQRAEQEMKIAAQNQPVTLEGLRLRNQALQASLNAAAQQRAAAAELARIYGSPGSGMPEMPPAAAPQPTAPPSVAPPAQGYPGLLAPYRPNAPAPAAPQYSPYGGDVVTPGPQSNIDFEFQRFGDRDFNRRFSGMRLASAGINDATGLPTGMTPEMLEPDYQQYPQTGFPTGQEGPSPTAPGALPAAMLSPEQRTGAAAPAPVATDPYTDPFYANIPVGTVPRPEVRPLSESPFVVRAFVERSRMLREAEREAAAAAAPNTQFSPFGESVPGFAGAIPATPDYTVASTEGAVGLRPQGAPTQRQASADLAGRLDTLTREAPDSLSPMDPYRVGVESRAQDNEARNIDVARRRLDATRREAALLARSGNTQGAMTLMANVRNAEVELETRSSALALQRANLNGRINTSEFAAGNFGPMANDIFQASGGRLRLQPVEGTDNFNLIGPDGQVRGTRTRQELISDGRSLYDTNYQNQIKAIRERRVARSDDIFKATVSALEQDLKDTSAATRDIAVKTAEEQAKAQYRGSDIRVTADQQNGLIIFQDSKGIAPTRILKVVPARDIRGREIPGQFVTQEVEASARSTQ